MSQIGRQRFKKDEFLRSKGGSDHTDMKVEFCAWRERERRGVVGVVELRVRMTAKAGRD